MFFPIAPNRQETMNENGFFEKLISCSDIGPVGFAHVIHQRLGMFDLSKAIKSAKLKQTAHYVGCDINLARGQQLISIKIPHSNYDFGEGNFNLASAEQL